MTNADKIRSMSDEELAKWLDDNDDQWMFCNARCPYNDGIDCTKSAQFCVEGRLKWLKQEMNFHRIPPKPNATIS